MHACHPTFSVFLSNSLSFLRFCYSIYHSILSFYFCVLVLFVVVFLMLWCCFTVHGRGSFYTACRGWVFTISPFNHFCLGVGVLLDHLLVCQLPNHHCLPMLAMPHPITRQRVLFCLLVHCGIPIRIRVGILSYYPSWHAPSDSNSSFLLLGDMSS